MDDQSNLANDFNIQLFIQNGAKSHYLFRLSKHYCLRYILFFTVVLMRIRGDILRTYQSIHTWTGIISGLVLFIGFYAGSLTMFKTEIEYWATPPSMHLSSIPIEKFDRLIVQATSTFDKAQHGFTLNFNQKLSPMTWYQQGGGRSIHLDSTINHATLSADGELMTQLSPTNELGELIDMLHRTAGIAGKVGHEDIGVLILGIAAVLYFLALVSGVIFLLPTLVKSFFALRTNKGVNRFWLDSHNLVGIISLPFHLIIAWTVVVFAFHDIFYGGLSIIYGDKPLFEPSKKSAIEYHVKQLPSISSYIKQVNELTDGYKIDALKFSGLSSVRPMVAISIINPKEMMRSNTGDIIYMNPYTFSVQYNSASADKNDNYTPIVVSFFSLHFGSYGGNLGRWLYFVMGLLGAFIFYSGNLLWLEKRRKKQPEQSKSNHFMASLTIGICLGSILGVVSTMLSSKWLYLANMPFNKSFIICYYTVFFTALLYSFTRGAARAAIHLQQLVALACLAIPMTSLLAKLIPNLALWNSSSSSDLIIDMTAFIFSGVFFYSAQKTRQRAYEGESNSIWTLPFERIEVTAEPNL